MNSTLGSVVLLEMLYLNVEIQEKPDVETQLSFHIWLRIVFDVEIPAISGCEEAFSLFSFIPHICNGRRGRRPCQFFLAGVNYDRFNAKNWHFTVQFVVIYA